MILVFGGTTEGRKTATLLNELGLGYVYSTKTKIDFPVSKFSKYRHGALRSKELQDLILEHKIKFIINASHPFATVLHETVASVAIELKIPAFRYERNYTERENHPLIHYVSSYTKALSIILQKYSKRTLLALTGVQSIEKLKSLWETQKCYFRILDRPSSIAIAKENDFPKEQLLFGLPSANIEEESKVIAENNIEAILTKESGESGFVSTKIKVAKQHQIPIIIIEKPVCHSYYISVYNNTELKEELIKIKEVVHGT